MDGEAVRELTRNLNRPDVVGDGFIARPDHWTVVDPATLIKAGPAAEKLGVYSLGAVRDYVKANRDKLGLDTLIVHIVSPQIVRLLGPIRERARDRETFLEATALNLTDGFLGKYMAIDEFIIGLQTRFVSTPTLADVLRLFTNVKHEGVKTLADDGITQTVTAKTGIVLGTEVAVPNPVALAPFRTFREVTQPKSLFALRVNGATTGTLSVGLFEADGGDWRLSAVDEVRRWLADALNIASTAPSVAIVG